MPQRKPLRGLIFDMGGTLLHYNAPETNWEDTEKTGARGIYEHLQAQNLPLPPETEALDIAWEYTLKEIWMQLDVHPVENLKLDWVITGLLNRWGLEKPVPELVTTTAEAYMRAIQGHVYPLEGAANTLRQLREMNLRIGLISNTLWPGDHHRRDLDRYNLSPHIEHFIFSADVEAWKPHSAIFQQGLDALGLQSKEAAYIGDSLYFDVWGAQQAGLRGVWIEQSRHWLPDGIEVTPDATIQRLPELLELVQQGQ